MPARVWGVCLGLIALLLVAVVGLDAWQTRHGETSIFGVTWGRSAALLPVPRRAPSPSPPVSVAPGTARLAVVIDGFGARQDIFEQAAGLGRPLTIAVLSELPLSGRLARDGERLGFEVLVEVPLEPYRYPEVDPGPGALLVSMSRDEVIAATTRYLAAIPSAVGVIGHMGSRFTEDREHMRALLEPIRAKGLVFVDGMMSNLSVGDETARALGIRSARRHVRVSHAEGEAAARRGLDEAGHIAEWRGEAVVVVSGHPLTVRLVKEYIPRWEARGIRMVPISVLAR
jgi:polysaccharide deacetylase 2 family uncharacterized protein YibQ